jgi:hypothetical protein
MLFFGALAGCRAQPPDAIAEDLATIHNATDEGAEDMTKH